MRQRKFIIVKDWNGKNIEIRIGYPIYHRDLLNKFDEKNHIDCYGGGRWDVDFENKTIKLYGASDDFGKPNKKDVEIAVKNLTRVHDWWVISHAIEVSYDIDIDEDELSTYKFIIEY